MQMLCPGLLICLHALSKGLAQGEVQVSSVVSSEKATTEEEQRKDPSLQEIFRFFEDGVLPEDNARARKQSLQQDLYTIINQTVSFGL